jgi:hypothetical protein
MSDKIGAVGFIVLERSLRPAPPHAKHNDGVASGVANKTGDEWTRKRSPAPELTIHGILNDDAE